MDQFALQDDTKAHFYRQKVIKGLLKCSRFALNGCGSAERIRYAVELLGTNHRTRKSLATNFGIVHGRSVHSQNSSGRSRASGRSPQVEREK
jgi:hypothetical protein